jgi:uncharacterized protein YdeI (YjbR/CyaY-like superfamily)
MPTQPPPNAIHPETRAAWRAWLKKHHARPEGVWLITWKVATGKPRIDYDEAARNERANQWRPNERTVRRSPSPTPRAHR